MADKESSVADTQASAATTTTTTQLKPLVGTSMARFLNQYNTVYDRPFQRPHPNLGLQLDPELGRLLDEERKSDEFQKHKKRKDWVKSYMDECVKFQQMVSKGKTGK